MLLFRPGRLALICASISLAATTASCAPPMPEPGSTQAQLPAKTEAAPPAAAVKQETPDAAELRARLTKAMPDLVLDSVHPAAIPGLYEVRRGSMFGYVSADGKYLISGDLVNLETGEELTENSRRQLRLDALAQHGSESIEFFPPKGQLQNVVTVFTDVDCGYCRKLHSEIASYNDLGIGIRYMFYPRSGPGSESFKQAESVWCSMDRKSALTKAKQGVHLPAAPEGCKTPVLAEYTLGGELGLRGTPMMVLPNGEVVNGYVPADRLAQRLTEISLPAAAKSAP